MSNYYSTKFFICKYFDSHTSIKTDVLAAVDLQGVCYIQEMSEFRVNYTYIFYFLEHEAKPERHITKMTVDGLS